MRELKAEAAKLLSKATGSKGKKTVKRKTTRKGKSKKKATKPKYRVHFPNITIIGSLGDTPKPELGYFSSNIAFQMPGNPGENAREVASKIKSEKLIAKATGPYINFFPTEEYSKELVAKILKEKSEYGRGKKKKEKVLVEFSQPNTHKGFHIGHLRNVCLGDSLSNILAFAGFEVIKANYINDMGAHVAKTLWAYEKFHGKEKPPANKGQWLGEIYAEACKKLKEDSEQEKEVSEYLKKLENKDSKLIAEWEKTKQWSMDEFKKIYKELGTKFDVWYYESDIKQEAKEIVQELLNKKIAKYDEGAVIVDNSPKGVNLLMRKDGTALYSTSDLALAKHKFEDYAPNRNIYVVGSEQKFHFEMLFETLKKWGFKNADKCYHLAYELVMLKSGKMKSREGEVILYEDFAAEAKKRALKEVEEKNPDLKNKEDVARAVGIGAIKYAMLKVSNNKTITFDWETALSFDGETAPYIQYANVRCHSILNKAKKKPKPGIAATELIYELSRFDDVIEEAAKNYSPHLLAGYAYTLADAFSKFYTKQQVIGSENEEALLALVEATSVVLELCLQLLGIEAPRRM